jgi:hypothetical protein
MLRCRRAASIICNNALATWRDCGGAKKRISTRTGGSKRIESSTVPLGSVFE